MDVVGALKPDLYVTMSDEVRVGKAEGKRPCCM